MHLHDLFIYSRKALFDEMRLKQLNLFGLPAGPLHLRSARDQKRAEKRREIEEAIPAEGFDNEEDSPEKRKESRCNWQPVYDKEFGDWIQKVPYTCPLTGIMYYMAGCVACQADGAVRGLGAHPTKKLKKSTFADHELTQAHEKVGIL